MNDNEILPPSIAIMSDTTHKVNRDYNYYKNTTFVTVNDDLVHDFVIKAILEQISRMAESVTYNNELSGIKEIDVLNGGDKVLTDIDVRLFNGKVSITSVEGQINNECAEVVGITLAKDYSWFKICVYLWGYYDIHMDIKLKEDYIRS